MLFVPINELLFYSLGDILYFSNRIGVLLFISGCLLFLFKSNHPCGFLSKAVEATRVAIRI